MKAKCRQLHGLEKDHNIYLRTVESRKANQERRKARMDSWRTGGRRGRPGNGNRNSDGKEQDSLNTFEAAVTWGTEVVKSRALPILNAITNAVRNSNHPVLPSGGGRAVALPMAVP